MASDKYSVMICDDEPDITTVLKMGLQSYGFDVAAFNNPLIALDDCMKNHHDINIVDIRMPGMSGFELAIEIWKIKPNAQVCFFTAYEIYDTEAKLVFPNLGSHCFLKKPIMAKELAMHIQKHMVCP